MEESKKCKHCNEISLISNFDVRITIKDIKKYRANCKKCRKYENHQVYLRRKLKRNTNDNMVLN